MPTETTMPVALPHVVDEPRRTRSGGRGRQVEVRLVDAHLLHALDLRAHESHTSRRLAR